MTGAQTADTTTKDWSAIATERMGWLYEEAWVSVFRYAFMLLHHREDAEDAASEAFGPCGCDSRGLVSRGRRLVEHPPEWRSANR